ncbi:SPFH domain-containing protein [bacterium]|nr:SPFH domain-containing protein [bacterium]
MAILGILAGFFLYFVVLIGSGFFKLDPNERAVITDFGRAVRDIEGPEFASSDFDRSGSANEVEGEERYRYPRLKVLQPGLHFKWPWQEVHKVSIATQIADISTMGAVENSYQLESFRNSASYKGGYLDAVTNDQLYIRVSGQIRYRVSEKYLYAYFFGIKEPIAHVMGFFHSVLREKIASYKDQSAVNRGKGENEKTSAHGNIDGIAVDDLRKNLQDINEHMNRECAIAEERYGIIFEAALITNIDPPDEVDSAMAAINTAHNQVSSDISVAQAAADQKIVMSKRAVEIETLKAQAEVEPLRQLSERLKKLRDDGGLYAYLRNIKMGLLDKASTIVMEDNRK